MMNTVTALMSYIIKGINTITSRMHTIANGCIGLCLPLMYDSLKVCCSNR